MQTSLIETRRVVWTVGLAWLTLALAAGALGWLPQLPRGGPQAMAVLFTLTLVAAFTYVPSARAWFDSLPVRGIVALHITRFVGIWFLVLSAQGVLSPLFAERAGIGDIIAASWALVLVAIGAPTSGGRRMAYLAWNTVGLLDLIIVLLTAGQVVNQHLVPGVELLLKLPLSLLPTFIVPILVASHILTYRRLKSAAAGN